METVAVIATRATARGQLGRASAAVRRGAARYQEIGALPDARRLLLAATGSYIGDRLNTIALVALAYTLGDGALGVGGMLALTMLPRLLAQGPAGVLVDRFPGTGLLVVNQTAMAVVAAAFALLTAVPHLWLLYALTLALATLKTVAMPAFEVQLMGATPPERRGTANALHTVAMTAGEFVGPLLGALVLAWAGAIPLFLLNGLSFLGVALAVARRRRTPDRAVKTADEGADGPASGRVAALMGGGYGALLRRPDVALYAALTVAGSVLILGTIALFAARADELGLGAERVGLFYAVVGIGSLVGGLLAGAGSYTGRAGLLVAAAAAGVGALSPALFGAAGGVVPALLALVVFELALDLEEVAALTCFQHRLPAAVFGRFFSLFLMANGLGGVAGALLGPALAEQVGTGTALTLLAVPAVALALLLGITTRHWEERTVAADVAVAPVVAA